MPTSAKQASAWLETTLEQTQDKSQDENISLELPMKRNKNFEFEKYTTKDLLEDQQDVACICALQTSRMVYMH
jgi:hypothetical protein